MEIYLIEHRVTETQSFFLLRVKNKQEKHREGDYVAKKTLCLCDSVFKSKFLFIL